MIKTTNWVIGSEPEILHKIRASEINIATYDRNVSHLDAEINYLLNKKIDFHYSGSLEVITQCLKEELSECPLMLDDIAVLVDHFGQVTETTSYRLTLATVETNMCRKFHTDMNDLRMLCTYSGPGTLWLKEENLTEKELNTLASEDLHLKVESNTEQAETGAVLILKGALFPIDGTNAILHRSPTIEESNTSRLLLRIDTNEFLNFNL